MPYIRDVALIFEGGGMRNAYTAGCVDQLLAHDIHFGWVGGVSAGATHTVNFLSGDRDRNYRSFVEYGSHPSTGGVISFLQGKGYFNAKYMYEELGLPDAPLPFDFDTFSRTNSQICIQATRVSDAEPIFWGKEDFSDLESLMLRVRASSTLPLIMPVPEFDGVEYVDGALSSSGGLVIDAAEKAGFQKFLIIRTKPRGYIRPEVSRPAILRRILHKRPAVAEAMIQRPALYNATVARIDELEDQGSALVFYPEDLRITATERRKTQLEEAFNAGKQQTQHEWDHWMKFLGL